MKIMDGSEGRVEWVNDREKTVTYVVKESSSKFVVREAPLWSIEEFDGTKSPRWAALRSQCTNTHLDGVPNTHLDGVPIMLILLSQVSSSYS